MATFVGSFVTLCKHHSNIILWPHTSPHTCVYNSNPLKSRSATMSPHVCRQKPHKNHFGVSATKAISKEFPWVLEWENTLKFNRCRDEKKGDCIKKGDGISTPFTTQYLLRVCCVLFLPHLNGVRHWKIFIISSYFVILFMYFSMCLHKETWTSYFFYYNFFYWTRQNTKTKTDINKGERGRWVKKGAESRGQMV